MCCSTRIPAAGTILTPAAAAVSRSTTTADWAITTTSFQKTIVCSSAQNVSEDKDWSWHRTPSRHFSSRAVHSLHDPNRITIKARKMASSDCLWSFAIPNVILFFWKWKFKNYNCRTMWVWHSATHWQWIANAALSVQQGLSNHTWVPKGPGRLLLQTA